MPAARAAHRKIPQNSPLIQCNIFRPPLQKRKAWAFHQMFWGQSWNFPCSQPGRMGYSTPFWLQCPSQRCVQNSIQRKYLTRVVIYNTTLTLQKISDIKRKVREFEQKSGQNKKVQNLNIQTMITPNAFCFLQTGTGN